MDAESICKALDAERRGGASFESLLSSAVKRLHASHPKFHWTGIYELFPDQVPYSVLTNIILTY